MTELQSLLAEYRNLSRTEREKGIYFEQLIQSPVTKIDLHDLEVSQIDWRRSPPKKAPALRPRKTLRTYQESAVKAVKAGRELAELYIGHEKVKPYPGTMDVGATGRSPLHSHNEHITLKDIPLEAYDYVVNGKSALDWVVERQCVKTDKDSGIINDANAWAVETMGNAKYPLELFMRVVTVSLETVRIVGGLPGLEVGDVTLRVANE